MTRSMYSNDRNRPDRSEFLAPVLYDSGYFSYHSPPLAVASLFPIGSVKPRPKCGGTLALGLLDGRLPTNIGQVAPLVG